MSYPAKSIANAFLNLGFSEKGRITPMKLQKLVYFAHGYFLGAYGEPLIDECFEAWQYGPVAPSLYHEFKGFGNTPISRLATELDWEADEELPVPPPADDPRFSKVLNFVWKTYGKRDALVLSDITHKAGAPWDVVTKENVHNKKNMSIPDEIIEDHFKSFVRKKG